MGWNPSPFQCVITIWNQKRHLSQTENYMEFVTSSEFCFLNSNIMCSFFLFPPLPASFRSIHPIHFRVSMAWMVLKVILALLAPRWVFTVAIMHLLVCMEFISLPFQLLLGVDNMCSLLGWTWQPWWKWCSWTSCEYTPSFFHPLVQWHRSGVSTLVHQSL